MQLLKELKRNIFYFNKDILIEIYNNINLAYKNIKNKHKKGELYSLIFISDNNMTLKNGKNIFKLIKDLEKDQENISKLVCLVKNESNEINNMKKNMFDFMLKIPYNKNELGNILSQLNK
jgi:predicted transcriptional regulator